MPQIQLQNGQIDYEHIVNPRLKHSYLVVQAGKLKVKSPGLSARAIRALIEEKQGWIQKKLASSQLPEENDFSRLSLLGERLDLNWQEAKESRYLYCGSSLQLWIQESDAEQKRALLLQFLMEQAQLYLPERLMFWAEKMALYPEGLHLKVHKGRWGSCTARQHINLNIRAMQLPVVCIDSILIHELAHIEEKNHGPHFWALVHDYCPDYKRVNKLLKTRAQARDFI